MCVCVSYTHAHTHTRTRTHIYTHMEDTGMPSTPSHSSTSVFDRLQDPKSYTGIHKRNNVSALCALPDAPSSCVKVGYTHSNTLQHTGPVRSSRCPFVLRQGTLHTYTHSHLYIHVCHAHTHTHTHTCVCVCVCVCTHAHTRALLKSQLAALLTL